MLGFVAQGDLGCSEVPDLFFRWDSKCCLWSPAAGDSSRTCLLPQGTRECWLCIPHLHNDVCSMAHSGSRPGVIPAVCITCGTGLNSVLCSLGLCSESKTVSSSEATWGTWLCSSSKTRELVGAAGLEVPVGMLRDAQLQPCSLRRWCCAIS